MNQISIHKKRHDLFFEKICEELNLEKSDCQIVAVLHVLPDMVPFLKALQRLGDIRVVVPKPCSINDAVYGKFSEEMFAHVTHDDLREYSLAKDKVFSKCNREKDLVILDIGGYFAPIINDIKKDFGEKFLGIVEDTENGVQRYEQLQCLQASVLEVARSPLKNNEDYMVGGAIAFSLDSILRTLSVLINDLSIGVIGYGKIGQSTAHALRLKQGRVSVYDADPVCSAQAYSHGFAFLEKEMILAQSNVLILATGNKSLVKDDFTRLKSGTFVATVTSSDDELDLTWVQKRYDAEVIFGDVVRYSSRENDHFFYLLNNGNAINFVHGTTVGDFILLVHAEILLCAHALILHKYRAGIAHIDYNTRKHIASVWLDLFAR